MQVDVLVDGYYEDGELVGRTQWCAWRQICLPAGREADPSMKSAAWQT